VKSASEEDALLKLCVIVCTILKKNMQVGCHISVVYLEQRRIFIFFSEGAKNSEGGGGGGGGGGDDHVQGWIQGF
jgi:hypothetical protein